MSSKGPGPNIVMVQRLHDNNAQKLREKKKENKIQQIKK